MQLHHLAFVEDWHWTYLVCLILEGRFPADFSCFNGQSRDTDKKSLEIPRVVNRRNFNGQNKNKIKNKTNNDLQNNTQKTMEWATRTH